MKKIFRICAMTLALLGATPLAAQTDYITGADGFTVNKIVVGNDNTNGVAREFWSGSETFAFDIYRDIEVPDGVYTFQLQSMYRAHLTKNSMTNVALYANTSGNQYIGRVLNYSEGSVSAENLGAFNTAFSGDPNNYLAKIPYFIVTDGKVKVGVRTLAKTPFCNNGHWFIYNPSSFKLSSVTNQDVLAQALSDLQHQANGLLNSNGASDAKTTLQSVLDAATATSESIVTLKEAIDTYVAYLAENATQEVPNDLSFLFLNPKFEGSTLRTVGAVNVYNDGGQPFGWVCYEEAGTGTANQGNAVADNMGFNHFTVVDNTVAYDGQTPGYAASPTGKSLYNRFAWAQWAHATFSTKQSVMLPAGSYKLSVPAYASEVSANYDAQIIFTIGGNVTTQPLTAQEWKVYASDFILTSPTEVSIDLQFRKILASANAGKAYAYFDGVTLTCYGDVIKALQTSLATELEKANGIKEAKMYSEVSQQLNDAIAQADVSSQEQATLETMIEKLQTAITAAETSIADYAKIKSYIEKADNINTQIAATYKTQYEASSISESAVTVFQNLEVATYNYVTENFQYAVTLNSEWTSKGVNTNAATMNNEHWSGTTRNYMNQNDENGQGWNAGSWSIDFEQDVTLPEGEYVFKVAGRKSDGATLQLIASKVDGNNVQQMGSVNDFPSSNNALGINKAGAASFDANDAAGFARNGNGYGWQWRYVKFTLDAKATVRIAVHAEASSYHQWVSFGDYTLQMTEETYLTANQEGLNEAMAPAQALVNTKPMGSDENTALQNAIGMNVTTGAELRAKIEALNTAIANANTWVAAYNEAKAPLVAQMERFETDFNGADGCTEKVCASVWTACIAEVQAAAEAKDVTDSYDGFEAAAENLKKANDDVAASIAAYANLKKEIGYAEAYTLLVGDNLEAYETAIAAAQAFYDAATGEDPSAVILAMQQFKVADYNYVTEHFANEYALGAWTGQTTTNKGEHWSGDGEATYYDYSRWTGAAGDFEVTQEVILPAGTYVLRAAGRHADVDGTSAYIRYQDQMVYYSAKAGSGFGIATDGTACFDPEGTYAGENGKGWEYRFIEFTLDAATTVTLGCGYTVADSYNPLSWASICTPQLFSKSSLVIRDKENFSMEEPFTASKVTYDRVFAEGVYTTVMLPFDCAVPDGVVVEQLTEVSLNGEHSYVKFEEVEEMVANTPYILKNTGEAAALFAELGETEIAATSSPNTVTVDDVTMKGTYQAVSSTELLKEGDVLFFNTAGELKFIDDVDPIDISFPAFRAYIIVPGETYNTAAGVAPRFTVLHGDDDVTAIEDTVGETLEEEIVYDLMGRRIAKPTRKGIYIINGSKAVVK